MKKISLVQAKVLKPYLQGDLDALCGLYSSINAIRLAIYHEKRLTKRHAKELMEEGLDYLGRRKLRLLSVCSYGMGKTRRLKLIQRLFNYILMEWDIELEMIPFFVNDSDRLEAQFIEFIRQQLTIGNPVCMKMKGDHNHYSVITGLSSNYIELFDSDGLNKLIRKSVRVGKDGPELRHTLLHTACFGVKISTEKQINAKPYV